MEKKRPDKAKRELDVVVGRAIAWRRHEVLDERGKPMSRHTLAKEMVRRTYEHWVANTVVRVEDGTQSLRLGEALAIARILGTSLDALINDDGQQPRRAADEDAQAKRMNMAVSIMEFVQAQDEVRSAEDDFKGPRSESEVGYTVADEILMPVEDIVATVLRVLRTSEAPMDGMASLESIDWKAGRTAWAHPNNA